VAALLQQPRPNGDISIELSGGHSHGVPTPSWIWLPSCRRAGRIPKGDLAAWKSMVFLRNRSSHPTSQVIRTRDEAVRQLAYVADLLNRLFKWPCPNTPAKLKC